MYPLRSVKCRMCRSALSLLLAQHHLGQAFPARIHLISLTGGLDKHLMLSISVLSFMLAEEVTLRSYECTHEAGQLADAGKMTCVLCRVMWPA